MAFYAGFSAGKITGEVLLITAKLCIYNSDFLLITRLVDDVNYLMRLITGDTVTLIIDLIVFIFSVTIVFVLSPIIGFILLGIVVIYVFSYRYFVKKIKSASSYRFIYDKIAGRLEETVSGARHVRIYNKEIWGKILKYCIRII